MSVYKYSFRIYIIFYHKIPFNKTAATLVRPHPFTTLCTTPFGEMWVCTRKITALGHSTCRTDHHTYGESSYFWWQPHFDKKFCKLESCGRFFLLHMLRKDNCGIYCAVLPIVSPPAPPAPSEWA